MKFLSSGFSKNGINNACPLTLRSLLLCILLALSYCFIVTLILFQYLWIDYYKPCPHTQFVGAAFVASIDTTKCNQMATIYQIRPNTPDHVWILSENETRQNQSQSIAFEFEDDSELTVVLENVKNKSKFCSDPTNLVGRLDIKVILTQVSEDNIELFHPELSLGGHWKPENCLSRHKIAVIIPYRDRKSHLMRLLNYLIPILQRQLLDFRFIVSEQVGDNLFNKGQIMNAAFIEAEKLNVDCVIFHDVDMFPEDDRISYGCPPNNHPKHLGAFVDVLKYDLWYGYLLGGVVAIRMEDYKKVNGHSNMFYGWGGEDDEFGKRVLANNMTIERLPKSISRYKMLKHNKRKYAVRENVHQLLNDTEKRWPTDGLNNIQWKIVSLTPKPLYYHLLVDIGKLPRAWHGLRPPKG